MGEEMSGEVREKRKGGWKWRKVKEKRSGGEEC